MIINNFEILKWEIILLYNWSNFCNLRITKIVLNKYLYLQLLNFKKIINFEILIIEKFTFKYLAILYILFNNCAIYYIKDRYLIIQKV